MVVAIVLNLLTIGFDLFDFQAKLLDLLLVLILEETRGGRRTRSKDLLSLRLFVGLGSAGPYSDRRPSWSE